MAEGDETYKETNNDDEQKEKGKTRLQSKQKDIIRRVLW